MKYEKVKNKSPVVNKITKKEKKIKEQITKSPMENLNDKRKTLKRKANESSTAKKIFSKKQKVEDFKPLDKDRTVFVGNIPIQTKEKDLKKFFSSYGEVETVRIHSNPQSLPKRKSITGKVCFISPESALKAKEAKMFNNFHMRVELLNEHIKFDPEKTIYLSKVPVDAEEDDVRTCFEDCGNVIMVNLRRDIRTNLGIGMGHVIFDSANAVDAALKLGFVQLGNNEVRINRFNVDTKKKITEEKKEKFQITVSNVPEKTAECDIHELLGKCGRIISSHIVHKDSTYCFVNFEDSEGMQNAINMQNPKLHGVPVIIKARAEMIREQKPSIYIRNLPLSANNKTIFQIFKDCGPIARITLKLNKNRPTGVGFINFHHEDAIEKALEKSVYLGTNKLIILRKGDKVKKVKNDDDQSSDNAEESEDDENGVESNDDEENDGEENSDDDEEENGAESDDDEENGADEDEYKNELDKILMDADEESDDSNDDVVKTAPKTPKNRKSVTPKKVQSKAFTPKSASKRAK